MASMRSSSTPGPSLIREISGVLKSINMSNMCRVNPLILNKQHVNKNLIKIWFKNSHRKISRPKLASMRSSSTPGSSLIKEISGVIISINMSNMCRVNAFKDVIEEMNKKSVENSPQKFLEKIFRAQVGFNKKFLNTWSKSY